MVKAFYHYHYRYHFYYYFLTLLSPVSDFYHYFNHYYLTIKSFTVTSLQRRIKNTFGGGFP